MFSFKAMSAKVVSIKLFNDTPNLISVHTVVVINILKYCLITEDLTHHWLPVILHLILPLKVAEDTANTIDIDLINTTNTME